MAKLARWGADVHMGSLFGLADQAALLGLGLAIVVMVVGGYRMWWLRRPTRGDRWAMGRPVRRGAWRSAPPAGLAALGVVAVAVGWFLPLLGLSLLAFRVVDLALAARARAA